MRGSRKKGKRVEQIPKGKRKPAELEQLHPIPDQPDKLYNDLAKFPEENPYPVLRIHGNGTVLYANKAGEPLLKARGSGLGQPAPAEWRQLVKEVLKSGHVGNRETRYEEHIWGFRAVPIAEGNYVNFYGIDITEHKRIEASLEKERQEIRTIIDSLPIIVFYKDKKGRLVRVNKTFAESLNIQEESFLGKTVFDLYSAKIAQGMTKDDNEVFNSRQPKLNIIEQYESARGPRWVQTDKFPILDKDGILTGLVGFAQDITERKLAEETLRETTQTLEAVIQASPLPIFAVDRERIVKTWNPAAERTFGWSAQEVIGRQYPAIPKEKMDEADALFSRALESGLTEVETLRQRKDGSLMDVRISAAPLRDSRGNINGVMAVITDITERKRAEEALKKSEAKLLNAMKIAKLGYWEYDVATDLFTFNDQFYSIFRTTAEKVGGYTMPSARYGELFIHPDEKEMLDIEVKKAMETTDPNYSSQIEHRIIYADGEIGYIAVRYFIIKDSFGRTIKTYGANQDITERKRAEEELRKERDFARNLVETAQAIVLVLDPRGRIVSFNPYMEEISGYKLVEVVGLDWFSTFLPKRDRERIRELFKKATADIQTRGNANPIVTKKGEEREIEWNNKTLKDSSGNIVGLLSTGQDITERKLNEGKLLEYQKQLKQLASQLTLSEERQRRRIAAGLHDNVSQSLALAKIKLDTLQSSATFQADAGVLKEISDTLEKAIQKTRTLIFDISNPILYELGFESAVAELLTEQVREKHGIITEFKTDGTDKPLDDDVKVLLFRNVRELLINIIKYAKADKVKVSISRIDNSMQVLVEDNGVGFDQAEVKKTSGKKEKFGLFSIRESIEPMGGYFEIESKPGAGCRAVMTVPLKQRDLEKEE